MTLKRLTIIFFLIVSALFITVISRYWTTSSLPEYNILLSNFYPTEQNSETDYNFSRSHSSILIPDSPVMGSTLTFYITSPAPLHPRLVTFSLNNEAWFTLSVDQTPRTIEVLLPPEATRLHKGILVQIDTDTAVAPGDPRDLGLFFARIHVQPFEQTRIPWIYPAIFGLQCIVFVIFVLSGASLIFASSSIFVLSSVLLVNQKLFVLLCMLAILSALCYQLISYTNFRDRNRSGGAVGRGNAPPGVFSFRPVLAALPPKRVEKKVVRGPAAPAPPLAQVAPERLLRDRLKQKILLFKDPYFLIVLTSCIIYIIVLSWYSIVNHNLFGTNAYDLGIFDQSLWLISEGKPPYVTANGRHILGDHAAFILYPLASLYKIYPDVRILLVVQTIVISLGAIPLYLIARDHSERFIGSIIAIAYLVHPATHNMNLIDFHTDPFAGTALLFVLWGIMRRNWWLVISCCVIILIAKENFATTTAFIGLWLIIQKEWRAGIFIFISSILWFFFTTRIVVPHFSSQQQSVFIDRFAQYGDTLTAIIYTFITRPHIVLQDIFNPHNRVYIWGLLIPFALLPLVCPRYLVLAMPALFLNLLSSFDAQQTLIFHYNALIVPILALASLQALVFIKRKVVRKRIIWAFCIMGIGLGSIYIHTIVSIRLFHIHESINRESNRAYYYRSILSLIPSDAAVSTQMMFQTHLSHREQAFMFPNPFSLVVFYDPQGIPYTPLIDYIMYDTRRADSVYMPAKQQLQILADLQQNGLYKPVVTLNGIVLLQRTDRLLPASCFGTDWNAHICRE